MAGARAICGMSGRSSGILLPVTEFADAIGAVLRACEAPLRASTIEPVSRTPETLQSLLDAGEDEVAFEVLCDNLYEDDIEVPHSLLTALSDAAKRAGASPGRIDPLLG